MILKMNGSAFLVEQLLKIPSAEEQQSLPELIKWGQ